MVRPALLLALPLMLAACGKKDEPVPVNDTELGNIADPQVTSALQGQIMVDPQLTQMSNKDALRPPPQPYSAMVPSDAIATNNDKIDMRGMLKAPPAIAAGKDCPQCAAARESITLDGLASRQKNARTSQCASALNYSARWATRLPADLPLFPQARVIEAAGNQSGKCALRVVTFSTAQPMELLLDWYYTKAKRGGYTAEHQVDGKEHILGGTRARDDAAYVLFLTSRPDGGTDIDMVANNGI
ncbi:hypothetical protein [Sphingomonas sp. S2-65]|uniref:hypothetical protein n=1 Tax=Sphingomonas sp. S2-65 TaxID=2903960 RepID=UPI001F2D2C0A|nr:hypothetical protein [Sphingomonas sp. S2-65]UYY58285.1 hypothetical protein LZ586_16745 [Sphingomonas sp. S2-65]